MRLAVFALPVVLLLALAPAASAGQLTDRPGALVLRGTGGPDDLSVAYDAAARTLRLRDDAAPLDLIDVAGCVQLDPHEAVCDADGLTALDVSAYDGDDTVVSAADGPLPLRVWIRGGVGDDVLTGGFGGEWIEGDEGDDVVAGGGGDDVLDGGPGADALNGGDGDDRILATEDPLEADDAISCGGGTDRFRGDLGFDARPADCELQLAQFTGPATITGQPRTGATVTVSAPLIGTPAPSVDIVWWSCAGPDYDSCRPAGHGAAYAVRGSDVGRLLVAVLTAENDVPSPVLGVDMDDFIASTPTATVTGDPTYVPPTPGHTPPTISGRTPRSPHSAPARVTTPVVVTGAMLAERALGTRSVMVPGARHPLFSAYVPAGRGTTVRIGARPVVGLALVSKRVVPVRIEQVLELRRRGSAKPRRVGLTAYSVPVSSWEALVVRVGLSSAQRRLVRGARSARVLIKVGGGVPTVAQFALRVRV